ncbi:MAG: serine protease [Oligoflexia bacterium]|nr:serine protease [Oligoflexia bacterium]
MKHLITLILSMVVVFQAHANQSVKTTKNPKIVGGEEARPGEFPFMVSLHAGSHFCGGSLIKKDWVLTAAHCAKGATIKKIYIGLHSQTRLTEGQAFTPVRVIVHPKFNSSTLDYDFALVQLNAPSSARPIDLNIEELLIPDNPGSQLAVVTSGWGYTKEGAWQLADKLQKVTIPLVSAAKCNKSYTGKITDRMVCAGLDAGGKDSCQGDSGGPLFVRHNSGRDVLVGVVSWGTGCARPMKFGIYSKVNSAIAWINQQVR